MRMVLNIFLSFLLAFSSNAYAEDMGKFTLLGLNEGAPFEGVLFDPAATATIIVDNAYSQQDCDLEIEYHIDVLSTEFQLERENFNIRYGSLKQEYELVINQKNIEIVQLRESLKSHSPRNNWWWAAGGVASGIAVTYAAYRVFDDD